jgi:hypothetical protein
MAAFEISDLPFVEYKQCCSGCPRRRACAWEFTALSQSLAARSCSGIVFLHRRFVAGSLAVAQGARDRSCRGALGPSPPFVIPRAAFARGIPPRILLSNHLTPSPPARAQTRRCAGLL